MLDTRWVQSHDFDVFHLHFGFDAMSPADLRAVVDAVHRRGRPLVYTVHDLRNPHHLDRSLHDRHLDVLVPEADAVLTLTEGAAAEIRRRWGRQTVVVPHPHVVDLDTMTATAGERARRSASVFRVGLHAKSLRPSMNVLGILPVLVETVAELGDAELQVNCHRDVMEGGARHDAALSHELRRHERAGGLRLAVHDFLPDASLWAYLASLDVSVLPYRFGTHSGWLEACRDLGTTVVAPTCGYYADQGPVLSYGHDDTSFDAESLRAAVLRAHRDRPRWGTTVEQRRRQRGEVAATHDAVYSGVAR